MKTVRVAAAVICDRIECKNKIFASARGYGEFKGGWEFPGGKIETGETPDQALIREIREEFDTEIRVGGLIDTIEYDYPSFHLSMDCFWAEVTSGNLEPKEAEAARWLAKKELDSVEWLPADAMLIDSIKKQMKDMAYRNFILRKYQSADCLELAQLFYETVHSVNRADYFEDQLDAWAAGRVDLAAWDRSFLQHETIIAETNGQIVGFGDMREDGYLDRLYVHKDYQRWGIAAAICDTLERLAGAKKITTHASITARGFFEKRGYKVVREQQVERYGVKMTNYVMERCAANEFKRE